MQGQQAAADKLLHGIAGANKGSLPSGSLACKPAQKASSEQVLPMMPADDIMCPTHMFNSLSYQRARLTSQQGLNPEPKCKLCVACGMPVSLSCSLPWPGASDGPANLTALLCAIMTPNRQRSSAAAVLEPLLGPSSPAVAAKPHAPVQGTQPELQQVSSWRALLSPQLLWRAARSTAQDVGHAVGQLLSGPARRISLLLMFIWFANALNYYGLVLLTTTVTPL